MGSWPILHLPLALLAPVIALCLSATDVKADDLDDVLDYLVEAKRAEILISGGAVGEKPKRVGPEGFFSKQISRYKADAVTRVEESGAVRFVTTYYSLSQGPSFQVKLVHPARTVSGSELAAQSGIQPTSSSPESNNGLSSRRGSNPVETQNELATINRLFKGAVGANSTVIKGYRTAFLGATGGKSRASILRLADDVFLVIQSNDPQPITKVSEFIEDLPIDLFQDGIGVDLVGQDGGI